MHLIDCYPASGEARRQDLEIRRKGISFRETLMHTREGGTIPVESAAR
jgi:hypothetical protein